MVNEIYAAVRPAALPSDGAPRTELSVSVRGMVTVRVSRRSRDGKSRAKAREISVVGIGKPPKSRCLARCGAGAPGMESEWVCSEACRGREWPACGAVRRVSAVRQINTTSKSEHARRSSNPPPVDRSRSKLTGRRVSDAMLIVRWLRWCVFARGRRGAGASAIANSTVCVRGRRSACVSRFGLAPRCASASAAEGKARGEKGEKDGTPPRCIVWKRGRAVNSGWA